MGVAPTRVLTSPYLRARQTAERLVDGLGVDVEIEVEHGISATSSLASALEVVGRVYEGMGDDGVALLAGHEPLLGELAAALCAAPQAEIELKKGGLVELDLISPTSARLKGLLRPRHLS